MAATTEIYLISTERVADCLACDFTIDRLVHALNGGTWAFCVAHMQDAVAAAARQTGTHLSLVPRP